ncbi:hypothetical protein [Paenibacillus jiagnxiensis]|uniref:hypothetical protein n=1 Tax=Paenibacillus jiagnxiensis TaxID=3228926 RepID=UPI0033A20D8A
MNRSSRDGPGSRELREGATQTKEPRISPGSGTVETVRQVKQPQRRYTVTDGPRDRAAVLYLERSVRVDRVIRSTRVVPRG